jgi:hypothetical protein
MTSWQDGDSHVIAQVIACDLAQPLLLQNVACALLQRHLSVKPIHQVVEFTEQRRLPQLHSGNSMA